MTKVVLLKADLWGRSVVSKHWMLIVLPKSHEAIPQNTTELLYENSPTCLLPSKFWGPAFLPRKDWFLEATLSPRALQSGSNHLLSMGIIVLIFMIQRKSQVIGMIDYSSEFLSYFSSEHHKKGVSSYFSHILCLCS